MFILNAFSLNMIVGNADIVVRQVIQKVAASLAADCVSAVGHADVAGGGGERPFVGGSRR